MKPILVMPLFDPQGILLPHIERITPTLREVLHGAVVSHPVGEAISLQADGFYKVVAAGTDQPVGAQFRDLYRYAAESYSAETVLHLCFPDRLAYQVEGGFCEDFYSSLRELERERLPLIYQRSPAAWETHPRNYCEIESAITTAGKWLFGKSLDFAWCHLAVEAGRLRDILPFIKRNDMSMMAEIVVRMIKAIQTQDVDWLAWEDPFILGRDAKLLKFEREQSQEETRKRLSYALPMIEVLYQANEY